ncbi:gephyrin-like isoform X2 [Onthophagus taurus]|uniref:gephyrin-like isoform X2 n=1 Tax=Onthophagus taurus TaxID=166361 RepID=UPI0039BE8807
MWTSISGSYKKYIHIYSCTVVPDVPDEIVVSLEILCKHDINLILTAGGTNLQANDIGTLARAVVGVKGNSLMINLPGNLTSALECFGLIKSIIPPTIDSIRKPKKDDDTSALDEKEDSLEDEANFKSSYFNVTTSPYRNKRCYSFKKHSFERALSIVCDATKYVGEVEEIEIENSLNRVLAPDDELKILPVSLKISKVDGYAVVAEDGAERILKRNYFTQHDDQSDFVLQSNEAIRVSMGCCLPKGANAVVPIEDACVVSVSANETKIMFNSVPKINLHVKSEDNVKFYSRHHITSAHIRILATLGIFKIKTYKCPRVGILATGDALYSQSTTHSTPGHSKNDNNLFILNFLQTFGYAANDLGIVKLNPNLLKQALYKALTQHDVIITTGGVSIDEYEMVKEVLELDFGALIHFGRVNMEPGYLTSFATCSFDGSSKFIFALPGDFASVMISCRLLVIPALRQYEKSLCDPYNYYKVSYQGLGNVSSHRRNFKRIKLSRRECNGITEIVLVDRNDNISNIFNEFAGILIIPENTEIAYGQTKTLNAIKLYS